MSKHPINLQNQAITETEEKQGPIQPFLHWINHVEMPSSDDHAQASRGATKRNSGFINGPYAEIKESIGRFVPRKSQEN